MSLKLSDRMSSEHQYEDKKLSGIEREDEELFTFPILCFPVQLKASTIYIIMTACDLTVATFSTIVALIITAALPVRFSSLRHGSS